MDPQLQQRIVLYAGLIPGAIALVFMMGAWYLHALGASRLEHDQEHEEDGSPRGAGAGPRWVLPLLLAVGVWGADYAINGGFKLWPDSNNDRLPHAAALLAMVGLIEGLARLPLLLGVLIRFIAYGAVFWILAEGYTDTVLGGRGNLIASTLFAGLAATLIATSADRISEGGEQQRGGHEHGAGGQGLGWLDSLSWILILGAAMPVFVQNNYAQGGMYTPGLISVLTSTLIVGLVFRSVSIARGGVTFVVGFVLMMLTGNIVQAGVNSLPSVLLAGSLALVMLIPMRDPSAARRLLARLALVALVGGAASLTALGDRVPFWPGGGGEAQQGDDASLEDYYRSLE